MTFFSDKYDFFIKNFNSGFTYQTHNGSDAVLWKLHTKMEIFPRENFDIR